MSWIYGTVGIVYKGVKSGHKHFACAYQYLFSDQPATESTARVSTVPLLYIIYSISNKYSAALLLLHTSTLAYLYRNLRRLGVAEICVAVTTSRPVRWKCDSQYQQQKSSSSSSSSSSFFFFFFVYIFSYLVILVYISRIQCGCWQLIEMTTA